MPAKQERYKKEFVKFDFAFTTHNLSMPVGNVDNEAFLVDNQDQ